LLSAKEKNCPTKQTKREKEKEKLPKDKKILKRRAAGRAG
jgi:hypothetical protein